MLEISAQTISNSNEYLAVLSLKEKFFMNTRSSRPVRHITFNIIVGVKCHGQNIRDIDLIVFGKFDTPISFRPFLAFSTPNGDIERPDTVLLDSFCLVVEVKAHSGDRVRFSEWSANEHVPGGRVVIVEGAKTLPNKRQFETWINETRQAGNEPVDMLLCVPPNMAKQIKEDTGGASSIIAHQFHDWGWKVWDGTSFAVRSTYPTDNNALRIVQYDSCRGLEGWTVVLLALDEFYNYKLKQLTASAGVGDNPKIQAARWLMIPLTRAMDTLVIHITDHESPVRDALKAVAAQFGEIVEWSKA